QTKGPDTDRLDLNHRVTSRLYTFGVMGWSVALQDQLWKDLRRAKEALP
ncbi:MAG: hypothetical protein QOE55_5180, partial [Acidobacteriaceae bacterium]|nr:hypothetical protein [Acidobacteriaceae bacterium]